MIRISSIHGYSHAGAQDSRFRLDVNRRATCTIADQAAGSSDAPPTRTPSISGSATSARIFSGFTLPPYRMRSHGGSHPASGHGGRIAACTSRRVLRSRGPARSDGPHRLVGNRPRGDSGPGGRPSRTASCRATTASVSPASRSSSVSPTQSIGTSPASRDRPHLPAGVLVRLPKDVPPLRVADQRGPRPASRGHRHAQLARERAVGFPVHVLRAHRDVRAIARLMRHGLECDRAGKNQTFPVRDCGTVSRKRPKNLRAPAGPEVHLPVGGEDQRVVMRRPVRRRRAAPCPSSNSSDAPPPVDTWVIAAVETGARPPRPPSRRHRRSSPPPPSRPPPSRGRPPPCPRRTAASRTPPSVRSTPRCRPRRIRRPKSCGCASSSMSYTAQSDVIPSRGTDRCSDTARRALCAIDDTGGQHELPARPARAGPRAISTRSASTSDFPVSKPMAAKNVHAMAPPIRISSTLGSSASMTSILPEIFAPPSTATNGRAARSSASAEVRELPRHQEAGDRGLEQVRHALGGGVRPVGGPERVVRRRSRRALRTLGQRRVVLLFPGVEPGVLEQGDAARVCSCRVARTASSVSRIGQKRHGDAEFAARGRSPPGRSENSGFRRPLGPAEVRGQDARPGTRAPGATGWWGATPRSGWRPPPRRP